MTTIEERLVELEACIGDMTQKLHELRALVQKSGVADAYAHVHQGMPGSIAAQVATHCQSYAQGMNARIDATNRQVDALKARVDGISTAITGGDGVIARMKALEGYVEELDKRMPADLCNRMDALERAAPK